MSRRGSQGGGEGRQGEKIHEKRKRRTREKSEDNVKTERRRTGTREEKSWMRKGRERRQGIGIESGEETKAEKCVLGYTICFCQHHSHYYHYNFRKHFHRHYPDITQDHRHDNNY